MSQNCLLSYWCKRKLRFQSRDKTVRRRQMKYTDDHFRLIASKNSRQNFFISVLLDNQSKTKNEACELANEKCLQQGNKKIQKQCNWIKMRTSQVITWWRHANPHPQGYFEERWMSNAEWLWSLVIYIRVRKLSESSFRLVFLVQWP